MPGEVRAVMDVALMLLSLCGPGHAALAPLVAREAARYEPHRPAVLVAMARVESTCDPSAEDGRGDYGLLQIRVGTRAARGHTAEELKRPRLNLHLGAAHLADRLRLCNGNLLFALYVYAGRKKCRDYGADKYGRDYARRVLRWTEQAEREDES